MNELASGTASISAGQFRNGLKTQLFLQAYTRSSENFSFKSVVTYLLAYLLTIYRQNSDIIYLYYDLSRV